MAKIPSPCTKICQIDPITKLCEGCFRSLEDIGQWSILSPEERERIWEELPRRMEEYYQKE